MGWGLVGIFLLGQKVTDIFSLLVLFLITVISFSAIVFVFYITIVGHIKGVPFAKSSQAAVKTILDLAAVKKNDLIVDFGSSDGTILIEGAKRGARAVGIEINPFLVWYCRLRVKVAGLGDRVDIRFGDFRKFPLKDADIVFLYLLPKTVRNLTEKFKNELKVGARLVSKGTPLRGWKHKKEQNNIFLYHKNN